MWITTVAYTRPHLVRIRRQAGIVASVRLRIATRKICLTNNGVKDDCYFLLQSRHRGTPFSPRALIRIQKLAVGHFSGHLHAALAHASQLEGVGLGGTSDMTCSW